MKCFSIKEAMKCCLEDSNFVEAQPRSSFGVELAEPSRVVFDALVAP